MKDKYEPDEKALKVILERPKPCLAHTKILGGLVTLYHSKHKMIKLTNAHEACIRCGVKLYRDDIVESLEEFKQSIEEYKKLEEKIKVISDEEQRTIFWLEEKGYR